MLSRTGSQLVLIRALQVLVSASHVLRRSARLAEQVNSGVECVLTPFAPCPPPPPTHTPPPFPPLPMPTPEQFLFFLSFSFLFSSFHISEQFSSSSSSSSHISKQFSSSSSSSSSVYLKSFHIIEHFKTFIFLFLLMFQQSDP